MSNQRLRSVQLPCSHYVLAPAYQTGDPAEYKNSLCPKCSGGAPEKSKALPKPATPQDVTKSLEERKKGN